MKVLYAIINQNILGKSLPLLSSIIHNLNTVCSPYYILYHNYGFPKKEVNKHLGEYDNIISLPEKNDISTSKRLGTSLKKAHELQVDKIIFIGCKGLFFKKPDDIVNNYDMAVTVTATPTAKPCNSWIAYFSLGKRREETYKNFKELRLYTGWYTDPNKKFFCGSFSGAMFNKDYINYVQPYLNKILEIEEKSDRTVSMYHELILYFLLFKMLSEKLNIDIEEVVNLFPDNITKTNMNRVILQSDKNKIANVGDYKISHGILPYPDHIFKYCNIKHQGKPHLPVEIVKQVFENNLFGKVFSDKYCAMARFKRDVDDKARQLLFHKTKINFS